MIFVVVDMFTPNFQQFEASSSKTNSPTGLDNYSSIYYSKQRNTHMEMQIPEYLVHIRWKQKVTNRFRQELHTFFQKHNIPDEVVVWQLDIFQENESVLETMFLESSILRKSVVF